MKKLTVVCIGAAILLAMAGCSGDTAKTESLVSSAVVVSALPTSSPSPVVTATPKVKSTVKEVVKNTPQPTISPTDKSTPKNTEKPKSNGDNPTHNTPTKAPNPTEAPAAPPPAQSPTEEPAPPTEKPLPPPTEKPPAPTEKPRVWVVDVPGHYETVEDGGYYETVEDGGHYEDQGGWQSDWVYQCNGCGISYSAESGVDGHIISEIESGNLNCGSYTMVGGEQYWVPNEVWVPKYKEIWVPKYKEVWVDEVAHWE